MSELFLIRHGQASFGAKNYDKLSEKGVAQSKILGQHFSAMEVTFDAIYCGQMERQKNTAKAVIDVYKSKETPIPGPYIDAAFNEYDSKAIWDAQTKMMLKDDPKLLDAMNMDNKKAFQKIFSKVVERWISGEFNTKGVMPWRHFKKQVTHGLETIVQKWCSSKKIAIFSSAGAICAAIQKVLTLSDAKTIDLSWQVMNTSVTRMTYNSKKISLSGFNNITHLELTGDKSLLTYR